MHFKQTRLVFVLGVSYIFFFGFRGAVIMDYMANSEKQIFDRVYQTPLHKSCNIILVFFLSLFKNCTVTCCETSLTNYIWNFKVYIELQALDRWVYSFIVSGD